MHASMSCKHSVALVFGNCPRHKLWVLTVLTHMHVQRLSDDYQGPARGQSNKPGPRLYEPEGKRFTLLQGDSQSARVFQ